MYRYIVKGYDREVGIYNLGKASCTLAWAKVIASDTLYEDQGFVYCEIMDAVTRKVVAKVTR